MRIIISDEYDGIRLLYKEILKNAGHEIVAETSNGPDALSFCSELSPDLLILDRDGIEVARRIRDQPGGVPIILCTADPEEIHEEARRLGVRNVLPKPFEYSAFLEAVASAGETKRNERHTPPRGVSKP